MPSSASTLPAGLLPEPSPPCPPSQPDARRRLLLLAPATLWLAACAQTPLGPDDNGVWAGTLAVRIDREPVLLWTAQYRLQGDAAQGRLSFHELSGRPIAVATWSAQETLLQVGDEQRALDGLEDLPRAMFGEDIPVQAWLAWLAMRRDRSTPAGWVVDDSRRDRGVLWARRPQGDGRAPILMTITRAT